MSRVVTTNFRNELILALQESGLPAAPPVPGSPLAGNTPGNTATIKGLPWSLICSARVTSNFSEVLHGARRLAESERADLYAAVVHRRGHEVPSDYVLMPFSVFVDVLKKLHPELLATVERKSA